MKQEIEDFYNGYKLPIRSMIRAGGRRGLTPESVMEAAEVVYNEIQEGLQIRPIRIAWRVYEKAGPLIAKKKQERANAIDEIRKTVQELKVAMENEKEDSVARKTIGTVQNILQQMSEDMGSLRSNTLADIKQALQSLKAQIDWHTLPWYIKLWRWLNVDHQ